jgi:hypothetical protein
MVGNSFNDALSVTVPYSVDDRNSRIRSTSVNHSTTTFGARHGRNEKYAQSFVGKP